MVEAGVVEALGRVLHSKERVGGGVLETSGQHVLL